MQFTSNVCNSTTHILARNRAGGSAGGTLVGIVSGIFEKAITAAFPSLSAGLEKEKWLKINPTTDAKVRGAAVLDEYVGAGEGGEGQRKGGRRGKV